MNILLFYFVIIGMLFHFGMVLGDTFIETFSTGRLRDFLTEKEENYRQKPLPDHLKSIQLPSEW